MKNFIKSIQKKEEKITASYINKELKRFEKILNELEKEHEQIKEAISSINYLLDLIENHQINPVEVKSKTQEIGILKEWLEKITDSFEQLYLTPTNHLTPQNIAYLKIKKSKLLFEKKRLEKEHTGLHELIAKTSILLMDARETACQELSKGHSIASVGEKLLEHFGRKVVDEFSYNAGKRKIIHFLKNKFQINTIQSKGIFDLLEKSGIIKYTTEVPNILINNYSGNFDYYANYTYVPLLGTWYINA